MKYRILYKLCTFKCFDNNNYVYSQLNHVIFKFLNSQNIITSTMLSTIISKYNVVVIINVIFIVFSDRNYELRRFKTSHKWSSSVFSTLKHRFLKGGNNVTSVFYIFNKAFYILNRITFSIKLLILNITRLNLTCLDRGICFYINVFFLYTYFLLT